MFGETVKSRTFDFWMSIKTQSSPKASDVWTNLEKGLSQNNSIMIMKCARLSENSNNKNHLLTKNFGSAER